MNDSSNINGGAMQLINTDYAAVFPYIDGVVNNDNLVIDISEESDTSNESHVTLPNENSDSTSTDSQQSPSTNNCCVCREQPSEFSFVPCGHLSICEACKQQYSLLPDQVCPMCMTNYTSKMRIFL